MSKNLDSGIHVNAHRYNTVLAEFSQTVIHSISLGFLCNLTKKKNTNSKILRCAQINVFNKNKKSIGNLYLVKGCDFNTD